MCDEVRWVGGGGGGRDTRLRRWSESDGASWRCFYCEHNDNNYRCRLWQNFKRFSFSKVQIVVIYYL